MEYIKLENGIRMPKLGFGVYQIPKEETEKCVLDAINVGYRLIDTAQRYGNEEEVGNAIVKCKIPREELFITTKIWIDNYGYDKCMKSVLESMKKLKIEYIDLVLIHQPFGDYYGAYKALEELYEKGIIKAIGVSNFYPDRLVDMCLFGRKIIPHVNQVETNVYNQQWEEQEIMKKYNVQMEAWAPFGELKEDIFSNRILNKIGKKYNKTVAQIILRYLLDRDIVTLTKSTHIDRMKENIDIFNFKLDESDINKIKKLDRKTSMFYMHNDYKVVEMFNSK